MKQYTIFEQVRMMIPKWVWALGAFVFMGCFYILMPLLAIYGAYKLLT